MKAWSVGFVACVVLVAGCSTGLDVAGTLESASVDESRSASPNAPARVIVPASKVTLDAVCDVILDLDSVPLDWEVRNARDVRDRLSYIAGNSLVLQRAEDFIDAVNGRGLSTAVALVRVEVHQALAGFGQWRERLSELAQAGSFDDAVVAASDDAGESLAEEVEDVLQPCLMG
jgi:hypothetical protein